MPPDRKKPGVAFWASVVVVVLVLSYPLSWGPACWLTRNGWVPEWLSDAANFLYFPLLAFDKRGPAIVVRVIDWYMELWGC
jgi:hypothetical protein